MSNINIKSDMGGGNPLNIIRIPSINEGRNIIVSSDLNGSITPGNSYTWQYNNSSHAMMYQNNKNELALAYKENDWIQPTFYDKSTIFTRGNSFHTVIEFREY